MPWMSENDHCYNPNRNILKDRLYFNRAKNLMSREKFEKFQGIVQECSTKDLDRDVEFRLLLDCLELISIGVEHQEVANIFAADVEREIELARISPIQGCIAGDLVREYSDDCFDIDEHLSDQCFFKKSVYEKKK